LPRRALRNLLGDLPNQRRKVGLDGSFIKSVSVNDKAAAVVRSMLGLGRALNLPALAKGVESMDQLAFLQNELCDEAQGYLLGRPDNIEGFRDPTHGSTKAPPIDLQRGSKASSSRWQLYAERSARNGLSPTTFCVDFRKKLQMTASSERHRCSNHLMRRIQPCEYQTWYQAADRSQIFLGISHILFDAFVILP
jgi:hypothetical protein